MGVVATAFFLVPDVPTTQQTRDVARDGRHQRTLRVIINRASAESGHMGNSGSGRGRAMPSEGHCNEAQSDG